MQCSIVDWVFSNRNLGRRFHHRSSRRVDVARGAIFAGGVAQRFLLGEPETTRNRVRQLSFGERNVPRRNDRLLAPVDVRRLITLPGFG